MAERKAKQGGFAPQASAKPEQSGGSFNAYDYLDQYKEGGEFKAKADKAWKEAIGNWDMDDPRSVKMAISFCDSTINDPNTPIEKKYGNAIAKEELESKLKRLNWLESLKEAEKKSNSAPQNK